MEKILNAQPNRKTTKKANFMVAENTTIANPSSENFGGPVSIAFEPINQRWVPIDLADKRGPIWITINIESL